MKKNTMKKLTALTCAGAMSLSLAACGSGGNSDPSSSGEAGGADVRHALLLEADDEILDAIELLRELGTGLHNHIS